MCIRDRDGPIYGFQVVGGCGSFGVLCDFVVVTFPVFFCSRVKFSLQPVALTFVPGFTCMSFLLNQFLGSIRQPWFAQLLFLSNHSCSGVCNGFAGCIPQCFNVIWEITQSREFVPQLNFIQLLYCRIVVQSICIKLHYTSRSSHCRKSDKDSRDDQSVVGICGCLLYTSPSPR